MYRLDGFSFRRVQNSYGSGYEVGGPEFVSSCIDFSPRVILFRILRAFLRDRVMISRLSSDVVEGESGTLEV